MREEIKQGILYLLFGLLMVNGIVRFSGTSFNFGDGFFMVSVLLFVIGIIRYLDSIDLFTFVEFSYKKFFEVIKNKNYSKENSKLKDYHEYLVSKDKVKKPYISLLLNGLFFFTASAYIAKDMF